ncbi:MAG: substrate-binding domain-containing protein, partial [Planctomycetota bacterium]
AHLTEIHDSGIPLVLIDRCFPDLPIPQVTSRHYDGALGAVKLILEKGHRAIGVLQGLPGTLPNEERISGYRDALNASGASFDASRIAGENFTEASGYSATKHLLEKHPDTTALFACSTPNAIGALRAANELGMDVPGQLSIVAFDDAPFADLMSVPLTTVSQNIERLGQRSARMLSQIVGGSKTRRSKTPQCVRIPTRLIRRRSLSAPHHRTAGKVLAGTR